MTIRNPSASTKPDWFDYRSKVRSISSVEIPRRQLTITGITGKAEYYSIIIWQEHPTDEWLIEICRNTPRSRRSAYKYISLSTHELRFMFGLAYQVMTADLYLAKILDAGYVIPRVCARTRNYLVLPGPTTHHDLFWPEDTLTVSILLNQTIRDRVRTFISA